MQRGKHVNTRGAARAEARGDALAVGILTEQRYLTQAQPVGLRDALVAAGQRVRIVDVDAAARDLADVAWLDGLDVVVSRGRSWPVLALLAQAERRGVATVNGRAAVAAVHNKAEMAVSLTVAGLPVPATYLGSPAALAREVPLSRYPLILKPIFGDNARGLRVVHTPDALAQRALDGSALLAQPFLPTDGWDLKLYGIGDEIHAVRKPSPLRPQGTQGSRAQPVALTPELESLGVRCGALFGLELFGVDCVETPAGPVVIEVNEFPNYSGVSAAGEKLAAYLVARAEGARRGGVRS